MLLDHCAIILDKNDATITKEKTPENAIVLSFSPEASAEFSDTVTTTIDCEDLFTSVSHALIVAKTARVFNKLEEIAKNNDIPPAVLKSLQNCIFNGLPGLLLTRWTLSKLEAHSYWAPVGGELVRFQSQEDLIVALAPRFLNRNAPPLPDRSAGNLNKITAIAANRFLDIFFGRRSRILQADKPTEYTQTIAKSIASRQDNSVILAARPVGKDIFSTLRRSLSSPLRRGRNRNSQKIPIVSRVSHRAATKEGLSLRPKDLLSSDTTLDAIIRQKLESIFKEIKNDVKAGDALPETFSADVLVTEQLIQPAALAAVQSYSRRGVPSIMVVHGTDTLPDDRLGQCAAKLWAAQGRANFSGLTHLLAKSPTSVAIAHAVSENRPQIHAFQVGSQYQRCKLKKDFFEIVLAGNYRTIEQFVPWVTETPGEFLRGVMEIAESVSLMESVRLVIKLKPTKNTGLNANQLQEALEADRFAGKVVLDFDTPLSAYFETMDLLVGNNSATLQEALNNRIPVFLNTWRRHYTHFPARMEPPAPGERSAVYAVKSASGLGPMLTAIRDAHQSPLTDQELDGLVWTDTELAGSDAFLRNFLDQRTQEI
ncbi:hypothetical protein [Roseibium sp. RKSG952]|uniref:hypothetical protein n=1 Tax=Roseibium sp. RKSG952 TaxID=2529384 RepID=UPI0012BB540B|nr:hypothetical protein [Roseibium sp. RKSG952]MTH96764.1 hypothetical protein [Roseibium sp. RKSG952]